jgi:transcriptional regulator with XRE-family HTH domain
MPTRSKLKLKPIDMGEESLGQCLARLRKERAWTQKQIADGTGFIQELDSNYETDKLRLNADMILRIAEVIEVSTDELLRGGKARPAAAKKQPSIKLVRRMEQIEALPLYEQRALLTTIEKFLASAQDSREGFPDGNHGNQLEAAGSRTDRAHIHRAGLRRRHSDSIHARSGGPRHCQRAD